jgi:DNA processing protein
MSKISNKRQSQHSISSKCDGYTHYWLALVRTPGVGLSKIQQLLEVFPDVNSIFNNKLPNFGLPKSAIEALKNPQWELVEKDLRWLDQPNHFFITYYDELYPPLLKEIGSPPFALYIDGDPKILTNEQLAMVGSRNPTPHGLDNAFDFAKALAGVGLTITSGLAFGIDSECHKGALQAKGKTIAVLGTGVDIIYPASNKKLASDIVNSGGALISEVPIGTAAKPENFPRRNRIISGLSLGTLVVEATMRSGSLITARCALEQNREVYAIPGSIQNPLARGCNELIRQGAKLVTTAADILEEIKIPLANSILPAKTQKKDPTILPFDHQKILKFINYEATPIDMIVAQSGLSAQQVSAMLLTLELDGYVLQGVGGYIRV